MARASTRKKQKRPARKNRQQTTQQKQKTQSQKNRGIPRMLLNIISFLVGVAALLFVIYPRLSVSPGVSLDVYNPFKTPFVIKNDGYLPIFNVKYSLVAENMELINGITFTNSGGSLNNTIEKLSPNRSSALFVDRIFSVPPNSVKSAQVFVNVTYRPFLVPFSFTEKTRFKAEINSRKEYAWFESYDKP